MIEALCDEWMGFLKEYYKTQIEEICLFYPSKKSLYVDYWDLDRYSKELAEMLLSSPRETLAEAERALKNFEGTENKEIPVRIRNLTKASRVKIGKMRSEHLNKFLAVEGLVKKVTEVRPILKVGIFQCPNCDEITEVVQESRKLKEPLFCDNCNKRVKFRFLAERSSFSDTQKIEIQDAGESLSTEPVRINVYLEGDLTGTLNPGDHVLTNGTLCGSIRLDDRKGKTTIFDKYMEANSFELQEEKFEEIEISDEDERRIVEISRDENLIDDLVASISPTIYGLEMEKRALALQLFSGLQKEMEDGTRIRGDIHILFVGDPGTAKSQLLRYVAQLAPRGIYASGKSSSAAGLTVTVVKDAFGEGRWSLEAGILVLADKGIACIDEIDKMTPQDSGAMHQAMEQQEVSVAKAGISSTLNTRCSILGAANPQYGRFDPYKSTAEQINLSPALLSRFDLIFSFIDKPNPSRDKDLAEHIAKVHYSGELMESRKAGSESELGEDVENVARPVIEPLMLKKYIAYAKRFVPILTEKAINKLVSYYTNLRKIGEREKAIPITARQFEAMIRLAEASARSRLCDRVEEKDCEIAIEIMDYCLRKMAIDSETGLRDIDFIIGRPASQRSRMDRIVEIIKELEEEDEKGADESEVLRIASSEKIPEFKTSDTLRKLKSEGIIYEPRNGRLRVIKGK
jgi:replicative DNA helicase Mcm